MFDLDVQSAKTSDEIKSKIYRLMVFYIRQLVILMEEAFIENHADQ